jgi:pimeloyl-ACP methyl ester carboxylesterase
MNLVIFSHGKESGPDGSKIKLLRDVAEKNHFETVSLDYRQCKNADERIALLENYLETTEAENIILFGSSMGGYVSTVLACKKSVKGLFLLCPALYMNDPEYSFREFSPQCEHIELVHGWQDDIVYYENSIRFAKANNAVLNLITDGHRLQNSLEFLENRFEIFLKRL